MKILCVGDYIEDRYVFGTATRLCPEAPVPVIVPQREYKASGGAGLVADQLREFTSDIEVWYGSFSVKERTFANDRLLSRIDRDSIPHTIPPREAHAWNDAEVFVVSDYGKGAMTPELARKIVDAGKPCFVDAKHHWHWYEGKNVTIFPNHVEATPVPMTWETADRLRRFECSYGRIVSKMGKDGCRLNDAEHKDLVIPATVTEVVDVCGAGDTFMASFVYAWSIGVPVVGCLEFANTLAGEACRHLGTHVVSRQYAEGVLAKILGVPVFVPQCHASSPGSTPEDFAQWHRHNQIAAAGDEGKVDIPDEDSRLARAMTEVVKCNTPLWQTPRRSPSNPIASPDTPLPSDQEKPNDSGKKSE